MQKSGPCFTARRTTVGHTCQITLAGECDLAAMAILEREVEAAFAWPVRWLVLDLSGLTFLDASGVRAIMLAHLRCIVDGVELRIVRGPRSVHRVFQLTRTDHLLPFAPPRPDEATEADATPAPLVATRSLAMWPVARR